jgi:hypothetical protein
VISRNSEKLARAGKCALLAAALSLAACSGSSDPQGGKGGRGGPKGPITVGYVVIQ